MLNFLRFQSTLGNEHFPKVRFEKMQDPGSYYKANELDVLPPIMPNHVYVMLDILYQVEE